MQSRSDKAIHKTALASGAGKHDYSTMPQYHSSLKRRHVQKTCDEVAVRRHMLWIGFVFLTLI